jgi:hypothetical protein
MSLENKRSAMDKLAIPIKERSRKYGYIYWPYKMDKVVKDFLQDALTFKLVFNGAPLGAKNVDWKYRRISVGWRWTRSLPQNLDTFVLIWKDKNTINVTCR